MSRHNPQSTEEAFAYQFEDDIEKLLAFGMQVSIVGNAYKEEAIKSYKTALEMLKSHIQSYEEKK